MTQTFLLIWMDVPRLSAVMLDAYTLSCLALNRHVDSMIVGRTLFSELGVACWAQMGASSDFKIGLDWYRLASCG